MPVATRDRHFSFSAAISVHVEQVETVQTDHEENLPSEAFARGVAWDLVRFDIN
jgi:hypothetical protein